MVSVTGVRSIEMDLADVARAARFYSGVWGLTEVQQRDGSRYFRGTGTYHHILALHPAKGAPAFRRIVFDAPDRGAVSTIWQRVAARLGRIREPAALPWPGGGFGFTFKDPEGRNLAVVSDVSDHSEANHAADKPLKIAHVNVNAADWAATTAFLCDTLGLRVIDETRGLVFLHANSSDHNSIVVAKETRNTVNHVAFEMPDIDSVMRQAGSMKEHGYPIEWGVGRHGAGNNVFAYFAGPEEFPIEITGEVLQIDESYVPHGPDYWKFPPGRADQWGITAPHSPRWKRIQDMFHFSADGHLVDA